MAKHKTDAQWVTIDPATLSDAQRSAYEDYKTAYRLMKAQREAFENSMQTGVPEGQRIVCGYNFGKLSVAIVPDEQKAAKPKVATQSLSEFLKAQADAGRRA